MTFWTLIATLFFSDPLSVGQWHLDSIGARQAHWFARGQGVTVAVLDTGWALAHPDLPPLSGVNVVDDNRDVSWVNPHGTLVLGALAARTGNGVGIAGVAPDASILPIRVTSRRDGAAYLKDIARGIYYAADHGADIVLASYSVTAEPGIQLAADYLWERGGVLVMPSGNQGRDEGDSDSPHIVTVAASDLYGEAPAWSNYGAQIDIAAPGVGIRTTELLGRYSYRSGTSMAAAIAVGALAVLASAYPEMPMFQLVDRLYATASRDVDEWDPRVGWGVVDLGAALEE